MATDRFVTIPTHPGNVEADQHDAYHFHPLMRGGHFAAFNQGSMFQKRSGARIGGPFYYNASQWTTVEGGTSDARAAAVTEGGGLLVTFPSDDDFDMTSDDAIAILGAGLSGKVLAMRALFQISHATQLGFKMGLTPGSGAQALPFGTNYTDVIALSKPIASAAMVGTVRGNSGTAADTGTLATIVAATEIDIGFYAMCHATAPKGAWCVNGVVTPFTGAQLAQLTAVLTSPPTNMYWTFHGTGTTGNTPTLLMKSWATEYDI